MSVGWVDQYHQSTDGQQVDLTGLPNGTEYYLVSTTNPAGVFLEQDSTNNTATTTSPCEVGTGRCGERSTNR